MKPDAVLPLAGATPNDASRRRTPGPQRPSRVIRRLGLVLALLSALLAVPPAVAADKARMAVTLAQQASKSFESGDFARASDLYLAAWRTDPKPDFLFGAARSAHLGAINDKAVDLYKQFLGTEGADPERQKRAREYLAELELGKVQLRVAEADRTVREDPKVAAGLYLDAFKLAPSRFELLFKAAVAEQSAKDMQAAERLLRDYLARAPADAPDRNQAQARLESLTRPKTETPAKSETPAKTETPAKIDTAGKVDGAAKADPAAKSVSGGTSQTGLPTQVTKPAEPAQPRWVGWTLVGGGAALVIGGLITYVATTPDITTYNQAKQQTDASGKITGLSYEEMQTLQSSINTRVGVGWALAGVGVAAAGVGTWWLLTHPGSQVAVTPGPGWAGANLAVQF